MTIDRFSWFLAQKLIFFEVIMQRAFPITHILAVVFTTGLSGSWAFGQFNDSAIPGESPATERLLEIGGSYQRAVVAVNLSGRPGLLIEDLRLLNRLSSSLLYLNLNKSGLRDHHLTELRGLTSIRILMLGSSDITDHGLLNLAFLERLEQLGLNDTKVTGTGCVTFREMPLLRQLSVDGCPLSEDGVKAIGKLQSLRSLSAAATPFQNAWLAHLRGLPRLETLDLCGTLLSGTGGLEQITPGAYIEHVNVARTGVDDRVVDEFLRFPRLVIVRIQDTKVTAAGVERLRKCSALQYLEANASQVPDATQEALKKALPHLEIRVR